jgi:PAS domain S-box-containing protein
VIAGGINDLEREAMLLRAIVDSSDDAIISKDLSGIITSWNKSAERLFGYTAAEVIGQPITILIPPDRLDEEPEILARLKRGERVDHFETIRRRKDGSLLDISLTISPVKDREGNIVGASKIARDITENKRVTDELRRANRDLEQFAFSASHDLKEPLRALNIYSELLTNNHASKLDGEALEFLSYLRAGAMRMEKLVSDLLAYTQVTKFQKPSELADANEAVAAALQSLGNSIGESDACISTDVLPSVHMHPVHLQQLFQNLIGNAIKYRNREQRPVVRITADRQIGQWAFAITDNGIGIPSEDKEHIFGLFKRLHSDAEYSGTGIGLAICKRIVEQYNGRIWVESEPGQGSVFRFTLPN